MKIEKVRSLIREILFELAKIENGQDDLNTAFLKAVEILGISKEDAIWNLEYNYQNAYMGVN